MSARFWEAAVSKCVPKGSQLSSQVVSFFVLFQTFRDDALLGPQAHTRATRRTQNVAPGDTKSTPGGQKQPLQEPKSSKAATSSDAQKQRGQRTLHLPMAPRSQKTSRCGGVAQAFSICRMKEHAQSFRNNCKSLLVDNLACATFAQSYMMIRRRSKSQ